MLGIASAHGMLASEFFALFLYLRSVVDPPEKQGFEGGV
jgi:hypothetical protein